MIWFTSDTHYFHYKEFLRRPFLGPEMDELLINNYNSVVMPSDTVYHLGDFGYCLKETGLSPKEKIKNLESVFSRLNGNKFLVAGNHDKNNGVHKLKWSFIYDTCDLSHNGQRIWLSHYAHRTWPGKHKGSMHLYGHSHGKLPPFERSFDVGVDSDQYKQKYFPISIEEVIKQLSPIKFESKEELDKKDAAI